MGFYSIQISSSLLRETFLPDDFRSLNIEVACFVHLQIVQKPTQEKKQKLTPQSKIVADHVAKLVHSAEALKGKHEYGYIRSKAYKQYSSSAINELQGYKAMING